MRGGAALLLLLAMSGGPPAGLLERCHFAERPDRQVLLPRELNEISGLTFTADGRLIAHDDEQAVLRELDPATGQIRRRWALAGIPKGDFEGIAAVSGLLFLLTSDGVLYQSSDQPARAVPFRVIRTGLGSACEFEGLGAEPAQESLLLACKLPHEKTPNAAVIVYRWSVATQRLAKPARLTLPRGEYRRAGGVGDWFAASGIDRDSTSGNYLLVSARDAAVLELTPAGGLMGMKRLHRKLHRQAEGIAVGPSGDLYISDEAAGRRALLSLYRCRP
jgi:uncharacterized protein YjiK